MLRWVLRALLVAGLVAVGWWVWDRFLIPDETKIRRQVLAMRDAVIQRNALRLSDCIAQDYSDDFGLNKSTLLGVARQFRDQYDEVIVDIPELAVTVESDHQTARAALRATVVGFKGGVRQEPADDRLRLFFRKTDSGWKLTRIEAPKLESN